MDRVTHEFPPDAAHAEGFADVLAAVRAADLALVCDDHTAALDAAAPELVANVPGGLVIDRAVLEQALTLNMISYSRYVRRIERVVRRATGEFLLMGAEEVTPKKVNPRFTECVERRRFTEIWRLENGRWLLSVRHAG